MTLSAFLSVVGGAGGHAVPCCLSLSRQTRRCCRWNSVGRRYEACYKFSRLLKSCGSDSWPNISFVLSPFMYTLMKVIYFLLHLLLNFQLKVISILSLVVYDPHVLTIILTAPLTIILLFVQRLTLRAWAYVANCIEISLMR